MSNAIYLNGLDGANPLGFLAAMGTLAMADHLWPGTTMAWYPYANSYRPILHCEADGPEALAGELVAFVREDLGVDLSNPPAWAGVNAIKDWSRATFRRLLAASIDDNDSRTSRLLAGLASDAVPKSDKELEGPVKETSLSHANGQGEQHLIKFYRQMVEMIDVSLLSASLYHRWQYTHPKPRFRWDPIDGRNFSVGVGSANTQPAGVELGANLLAFNALELITCYPITGSLITTGYTRLNLNGQRAAEYFTWPIWRDAITVDVARSLLTLPILGAVEPDHVLLRSRGVIAAMRSRRIVDKQKNLFFAESVSC